MVLVRVSRDGEKLVRENDPKFVLNHVKHVRILTRACTRRRFFSAEMKNWDF